MNYDHENDVDGDRDRTVDDARPPEPPAKPGGKSTREADEVTESELARRAEEEPATAHLPDESIRGMGLTTHPRYKE